MEINTEIGAKDLDLGKSEWIQNIIELWRKCEELIKNEKILSVGVADLHLAPLKSIYECSSSLKPCLDHFNIEGCCVVRLFGGTGQSKNGLTLFRRARLKCLNFLVKGLLLCLLMKRPFILVPKFKLFSISCPKMSINLSFELPVLKLQR